MFFLKHGVYLYSSFDFYRAALNAGRSSQEKLSVWKLSFWKWSYFAHPMLFASTDELHWLISCCGL